MVTDRQSASGTNIHRILPAFVALVWTCSPSLVLLSGVIRTVRAIFPVANLWVYKLILDELIHTVTHHSGVARTLVQYLALNLCLAVGSDIFLRLGALVDSLLSDKFSVYVSLRIMKHSLSLDLAAHESPELQDMLERVRRLSSGRLALLTSTLDCIQAVISVALLSSALIIFSPLLMVFLVGSVLPVFFGEARIISREYSALFRRTPDRRALDYWRFLASSLQAAKEVTLFNVGGYLLSRYRDLSENLLSENARLAARRVTLSAVVSIVSNLIGYGGYLLILLHVVQFAISVGSGMFLSRCFFRSQSFVAGVAESLNSMIEESLQFSDLFRFFALQRRIHVTPSPKLVPREIRRGIEFRDVGFKYEGVESWVLRHLEFCIRPGEHVALVGANGAGKSTITKLIARFYDPTEGQILLEGHDIREFDLDDFRSIISVMFQDYMRYDLRVRDNIGFGAVEYVYDDAKIEQSAKKGLATRLLRRLPNRLDQNLGKRFEGGIDLSGGEWQKIALSRTYMRSAQLLILDEPTASLDAGAEYAVFHHLLEQNRSTMAILISHRFSTVRMADRIVVLADGAVLEQGTHEELLASRGRYAKLFDLQAAAYR
jgi:ATP-binding cassette, subfamily B, bacterial